MLKLLRALPLLVLLIVGVFTATAARADGFFYCDTLVSGACTHFTAATDGVATFESLGLTGDAIGTAVGWGVGVIFVFFAIGLGSGAIHRVLEITLGNGGGG